jgi:hypothetical protein
MSILLLAAIAAAPLQPAETQPARWSLDAPFIDYLFGYPFPFGPAWWHPGSYLDRESARYVSGEPANLTFQLVNKDCSGRSEEPHVERLGRTWLSDVAPIIIRADIINRTGFIKDYTMIGRNVEGYGDRLIADWELTVYGYCTGSPIHIESVTVWFAWLGIGKAHNTTAGIGKTLEALDPISYILRGDVNSSLTLFTARFDFPPKVPPESLETPPTLTVRMRYPSGFTYEYDYNPAANESQTHLEIWGLSSRWR